MRLLDAIEFIIRRNNGPMDVKDIFPAVKDLVLEDDLTEQRVLLRSRTESDLFTIQGDTIIALSEKRANDKARVFRQRVKELEQVLRTVPILGTELILAALVHALATRPEHALPVLRLREPNGQATLEDAIREFAKRHALVFKIVVAFLDDLSWVTCVHLNDFLLLASQVLPEPSEIIATMRGEVSRHARDTPATPLLLGRFMSNLVDAQPGQQIYDPYAASGALAAFRLEHPAIPLKFTAVTYHPLYAALLEMELHVLGTSVHLIDAGFPKDGEVYGAFDRCICTPPFGIIRTRTTTSKRRYEDLFVQHIIDSLAPDGKAVIAVPTSVLLSQEKATLDLRRQMVRSDVLRAVVELPSGAWGAHSSVKVALLVLHKAKAPRDRGHVLMVNVPISLEKGRRARAFQLALSETASLVSSGIERAGYSTSISTGAISHKGYNLMPSLYLDPTEDLLDLAIREGRNVVPLKQIFLDERFKALNRSHSEELNELASPPAFIRVKDLAHEPERPYLEVGETDDIQVAVTLVDRPAILLSKQFQRPYPTIFTAENGVSVAVPNSILAIRWNPDLVVPEYLIMEMHKPYFLQQLGRINRGSTITYFTRTDLLDLQIELPPLDEQQRIVAERRDLWSLVQQLRGVPRPIDAEMITSIAQALRTNGLVLPTDRTSELLKNLLDHERRIERGAIRREVAENLGFLNHNFNNRLRRLRGRIRSLEAYLSRKTAEQETVSMSDPIRPALIQEDRSPSTLQEVLQGLKGNVDAMSGLIENERKLFLDEEDAGRPIEVFDINEALRSVADSHMGEPSYSINLRIGKTETLVTGNQMRFKEAVDNIFTNAVRHGFRDDRQHHIEVVVATTAGNMIQVLVGNDGTAPDLHFDEMITKGVKSTDSQGLGHGLYLAHRWMKEMDGALYDASDMYLLFTLPISFAIALELPELAS